MSSLPGPSPRSDRENPSAPLPKKPSKTLGAENFAAFEAQYRNETQSSPPDNTLVIFVDQDGLAARLYEKQLIAVNALFHRSAEEGAIVIAVTQDTTEYGFFFSYHYDHRNTAGIGFAGREVSYGVTRVGAGCDSCDAAIETIFTYHDVKKPKVLCCGVPPETLQRALDRLQLEQQITLEIKTNTCLFHVSYKYTMETIKAVQEQAQGRPLVIVSSDDINYQDLNPPHTPTYLINFKKPETADAPPIIVDQIVSLPCVTLLDDGRVMQSAFERTPIQPCTLLAKIQSMNRNSQIVFVGTPPIDLQPVFEAQRTVVIEGQFRNPLIDEALPPTLGMDRHFSLQRASHFFPPTFSPTGTKSTLNFCRSPPRIKLLALFIGISQEDLEERMADSRNPNSPGGSVCRGASINTTIKKHGFNTPKGRETLELARLSGVTHSLKDQKVGAILEENDLQTQRAREKLEQYAANQDKPAGIAIRSGQTLAEVAGTYDIQTQAGRNALIRAMPHDKLREALEKGKDPTLQLLDGNEEDFVYAACLYDPRINQAFVDGTNLDKIAREQDIITPGGRACLETTALSSGRYAFNRDIQSAAQNIGIHTAKGFEALEIAVIAGLDQTLCQKTVRTVAHEYAINDYARLEKHAIDCGAKGSAGWHVANGDNVAGTARVQGITCHIARLEERAINSPINPSPGTAVRAGANVADTAKTYGITQCIHLEVTAIKSPIILNRLKKGDKPKTIAKEKGISTDQALAIMHGLHQFLKGRRSYRALATIFNLPITNEENLPQYIEELFTSDPDVLTELNPQ